MGFAVAAAEHAIAADHMIERHGSEARYAVVDEVEEADGQIRDSRLLDLPVLQEADRFSECLSGYRQSVEPDRVIGLGLEFLDRVAVRELDSSAVADRFEVEPSWVDF